MTTAVPPPRSTLGLPPGSVRALLTLMLVAVACVEVGRGHTLDPLWTETLAIALAHYFTTRRFVDLSPALIARLQTEGALADEPRPLYLPGFTVRGLIILAFLGLALYLQRTGRLAESPSVSVLGLAGTYLLGVVVQAVKARWFRGHRPWLARVWGDVKAITTLLVLGTTAVLSVAGFDRLLTPFWRDLTMGLTLFYFGSR